MKQILSLFSALIATAVFSEPAQSSGRVVDFKSADGTVLKGTYFAAAKPGPGVLLLHQSNRDRKSWDAVAGQLANAGINTLTLDMRGSAKAVARVLTPSACLKMLMRRWSS